MERVTILGAGAMGSALATPLVANGHEVRLWGTELDDGFLAAIGAGQPHPRLGLVSGQGALLFSSDRLHEALDGATLAVIAVTSSAAPAIFARARRHLNDGLPVAIVSKGFAFDGDGRVVLLPTALDASAPGRHPFVAIGGPCKANEVAAGWPTIAVFAAASAALRERCSSVFSTSTYTVVGTDDVAGLELAAATKNAYAIGLGICDGLALRDQHPWHNLKAGLFAQAILEMRVLAEAMGGRAETVFSFAGVGDLQVTGLSGRNRALGELIGRRTRGDQAIVTMEASGQTVEGPAAARAAGMLVTQLDQRGDLQGASFPLLEALLRILDGASEPEAILATLLAARRSSGSSASGP